LIDHFHLDADCESQHYAIGIKELWKIDKSKHKPGSFCTVPDGRTRSQAPPVVLFCTTLVMIWYPWA